MTDTIEPMPAQVDRQRLARDLGRQARAEGSQLVADDGLLTSLTRSVLEEEALLEAGLTDFAEYRRRLGI